MEPGGEHQHEGDLHQFGWLQLQAADVDPALRALADMAHAQHQHEQRHGQGIEWPGEAGDEADVHGGQAEHHHEAKGEADGLFGGIGLGRAAASRIKRHVSDPGEGADQQDIEPGYLE